MESGISVAQREAGEGEIGSELVKHFCSAIAVSLLASVASDVGAQSPGDGKPDLSGIWMQDRGSWSVEELPFTAHGSQRQASKVSPGPVEACTVHHFGQTITTPLPVEILQDEDRITFLYETDHQVRRIFMDGRGHPDDLYPSLMGHSIGWWEDSTLVVETVGLREGWFRPEGVPYGEQVKVTERHTLSESGDLITVELTLEDPVHYTEPVEVTRQYTVMPDGEIFEYLCVVSEYLYE